jgi:hypothetical protein
VKRTLAVAGIALTSVVALAAPASAASVKVSGQHDPLGVEIYYTSRTITVGGSNIYGREDSGYGELGLQWYKCGDITVGGKMTNVSGGRRAIGTNFKAGTKFCLLADGYPANQENWTATLWWNVKS